MIHSISSADNADRACLSPRPNAAKKAFTTWTFSCVLIEVSPLSLHRVVSDLIGCLVDGQADHHQTERLERRGHVQAADIQRTQSETLDEGRDARLGLRIVGRDERVETSTLSKYVAEDSVERLHDMRAGGAPLAISCAPELPWGVTRPERSAATGLVMSIITLPSSASP